MESFERYTSKLMTSAEADISYGENSAGKVPVHLPLALRLRIQIHMLGLKDLPSRSAAESILCPGSSHHSR